MRKIILSLIFTLVSLVGFGQIRVKLSEYEVTNIYETLHFTIENNYSNPIYIFSISAIDLNRNMNFYYSEDRMIINSCGGNGFYGYADIWDFNYDLYITKAVIDNSSVFNSTYMITVMYSELGEDTGQGFPVKTDRFYTNRSVGTYLIDSTTSDIENIRNYTQNKYYDLTGKVIANPQKGKVYIYNNKKIVY